MDVAALLPGIRVESVRTVGEGLDHVAYEVNGELIVRVAKEPEPLLREAELLTVVAEHSPLPVPEPIHADRATGVLAYRKLPGTSLLDRPLAAPAELAPTLAAFLDAIHAIPLRAVEGLVQVDDEPLGAWLDEARGFFSRAAHWLPGGLHGPIDDFLAQSPPPAGEPSALCHNDLGTEHILVEDGAISGIIDWTDAAMADPASDLAPLLRDLGPEAFEAILACSSRRWDGAALDRAAFLARCLTLEDLAYGIERDDPRYADAARVAAARLFAPG